MSKGIFTESEMSNKITPIHEALLQSMAFMERYKIKVKALTISAERYQELLDSMQALKGFKLPIVIFFNKNPIEIHCEDN